MKVGLMLRIGERMPLIMQSEMAECGLACLAMVLGYYGFLTDLATMRKRFPGSTRGMTLFDVKQVAEAYALAPRAVRANWGQVRDFGYPAICQWEGRHFVVVRRVKRGKAVLFDPARGVYAVPEQEFVSKASDVFLLLSPGINFQSAIERTPSKLGDIVSLHQGVVTDLKEILLASLMMEGVALLLPIFAQFGIDRIPVSGNVALLNVVGVAFLFLVVFNFLVDMLRGQIIIFLRARLGLEADSGVYKKMLSLPQAYFESRHPGDILSRFNSLRLIQTTLSGSFVEAIVDGVLVVGTLALMSYYSLTLTGMLLVLYAVYVTTRGIWYQRVREANELQMITLAQRETDLVESIRGIQTIKIFGKQLSRTSRWDRKVVASVNADAKVNLLLLIYKSSSALIVAASYVLVAWVGVVLVLNGHLTIGMLVAFMAFQSQFISKGSLLLDRIVEYVTLQVHVSRVADIVGAESEKVEQATVDDSDTIGSGLELNEVSYRYGAHLPYVLESFSMKVREGECLAIKGPSGVGKSTIAKLILGLTVPERGELRLGNHPYEVIGLGRVRHLIGAVMQDDTLFEGSIFENITFFDEAPDGDWATECARLAHIDSDINAMPMRYETLVGNMGSTLSGGQKQRILIARALYKKPRLLLMDEATSHLDPASERAVGEAIRSLALTRIIFAHRETTLKLADRVLDLGKIAPVTLPEMA